MDVYLNQSNLNALLGLAVFAVIVYKRQWPELKWFRLYFLIDPITEMIYTIFMQKEGLLYHPVYSSYYFHFRREVIYIIVILAVAEILRKHFREQRWWLYTALFLVLFHYAFFPTGALAFYVPRVFLYGGIALLSLTAMKAKHVPLLVFAVAAVSRVTADVLMLVNVYTPWKIIELQKQVSPWSSTFTNATLLVIVVWPALAKLVGFVIPGPGLLSRGGLAANTAYARTHYGAGGDVNRLVTDARESSRQRGQEKPEQKFHGSDYLTDAELRSVFGLSASQVDEFLKAAAIEKQYNDGGQTGYFVSRKDVMDALWLLNRKSRDH